MSAAGKLRPDPKLELRLWLRMLACTGQIERTIRSRLREEFDTTLPRFDVLAQLDRAADGLTMGALSGRLMVSAGNVTGLVNRLAEEGLVETARLPEDRRTQVVRLTEAGKTAFDRMTPAHESWIDSMLSALTPGEAEALYGLLGKVRTGLQQETAR
ncbi:MAG: hypothetical protein TEF_20625 [Rhizobiales bacterium NRL2]|jgi:DNA-binding MarR family transcriptional regulator|nr:MAG: hypothetical protein TEF_20625 [Rhizobiales bacterium NRL2]